MISLLAVASLSIAQTMPAWVSTLKGQGFYVQEGIFDFFDVETCKHTDTCYAINPITPYGLMYLPRHPNESDSSGKYSNSCIRHGLCKTAVDGTFLSPSWRLSAGETIVLVGQTPPKSRYWSFSPSIYTRFNPEGWAPKARDVSEKIVACPKGPSRCEMFASVNDPINMQTVNVSAAATSVFNASFSMVLATDGGMERRVDAVLPGQTSVNRLRFPGAVLKLGVTTGLEDEFITVMRVEDIYVAAARDAFYSNPNMRVFRVSPPADFVPKKSDLFASFDGRMRRRTTGRGEHGGPAADMAQLEAGLKELRDRVERKHRHTLLGRDIAVTRFESFVQDSGYECIEGGFQCQGDTRDTIYAKGTFLVEDVICNKTHLPCKPPRSSLLSDSDDDAFYVVGVNHALTSQSIYSSLTIYDYPKLACGQIRSSDGNHTAAYTEMEDAADLQESAAKYFDGNGDLEKYPAVPFLYVIKFARNCTSSDFDLCYEVPSHSDDASVLTVSLTSPTFFLERLYIHPGTKSGPAVNETVLPFLIHTRA